MESQPFPASPDGLHHACREQIGGQVQVITLPRTQTLEASAAMKNIGRSNGEDWGEPIRSRTEIRD
jgi:hypothetical protein